MVKKGRSANNGAEGSSSGGAGEDWRSDSRFGHVTTDPRYRSSSARKATRVEIDNRFGAMFTDPEFSTSARSDKRGRPVPMSSREDLRRFYGLKQDDEAGDVKQEDEESDEDEEADEEQAADEEAEGEDEEDNEEESESGEEPSDDEEASGSESSSDEEFRSLERSSGAAADVQDDSDIDAVAPTNRLAITQQDWEQLKATDIYMLLSSHCPASLGRLLSVTVYPSRFGQRRMAEEATAGPLELLRRAKTSASSAPSSGAYRRSLRRHQLKRLWYYYAVAEFDCSAAAAQVFEQCGGLEVESTGGCLRLSYVPDGMQFGGPDDVPEDWRHLVTRCTGIDPAAYRARKLTTGSLNRTRVGLTWDETPAERTRFLQGLFDKSDFDEADPDLKRLSEFLALSSDEEDGEEADKGDEKVKAQSEKLRRALLGGDLGDKAECADGDEGAAFSDDELPDDVAFAAADADADTKAMAAKANSTGGQQQQPEESRKRSRRRRLKEQAKRAKMAKAGLLPVKGDDESDNDESGEGEGETKMPASEQELAMLVADRARGPQSAVTAADVAADARFGALFSDPSYHVDPTHSEAGKAIEVQRLIVGAKRRRAAMNNDA